MLKYYHKYFLVTQAQKNSGQKSAAFHCVLYSAVFPELPASAAFPPPGCRPGLPAGSSEISPAFPWLHVLRASGARWRGPEQISAAFPELRPSGASRSRCRCPDRSPRASRAGSSGLAFSCSRFPGSLSLSCFYGQTAINWFLLIGVNISGNLGRIRAIIFSSLMPCFIISSAALTRSSTF